ncbi:osmotically inducible protein OsmC [Geothermobacter hydrogeniphilus]|uniref:Osmotically inducible protein OsmC n=1 Tax=Geothermobacter hydrogeniphilus TaxID=1969733 RepID=A0A2K2HDF3_9BACT|nr:OsmC family protein [Geothermobacter hydrogeniphilus]PNU21332.1 osmotically inducible protein OsmC [Geothermobacter hydrogeniphilus]
MSQAIKQSIENLITAISSKPQMATSVFRASSYSEQDSLAVESRMRGFTTAIDEPLELGGTDSGPNPVEMLLAALGGCQEIVYRAYASVMGLRIERIEVHAKGYLDLRGLLNLAEVPAGFSQISFTTRIVSDEPEEKLRHLAEMVERHCPVMDTLQRPVPVAGKVEVVTSEGAAGAGKVILASAPDNPSVSGD